MENLARRKKPFWKRHLLAISSLAIVVILIAVFSLFLGHGSAFEYAFKVTSALAGPTFKSTDDRVNILLLGNAGGKHDGAYLTDTIMIASYNIKSNQATFISLPRDLWLDKNKAKINAIYEKGKDKGEGLKLAKETIGDMLGVTLHYAVRLDFSGFQKAIDEVEGIDVDIEHSFDDYRYPIAGKEDDLCGFKEEEKEFNEEEAKALNIEKGKRKVFIAPDGKIATDAAEPEKGEEYFSCRFEHIHFNKGVTHMDGETALKFVRSRKGTNGEGSDFARSARQQKVIESFRKKALSLETLFNPKKITGLIGAFGQSFESDIPIDDMLALYPLTKKMEGSTNIVLTNGGRDALLVNPPLSDYGGAWVLVPKDPSYGEIRAYIAKTLKGEEVKGESTPSARPR